MSGVLRFCFELSVVRCRVERKTEEADEKVNYYFTIRLWQDVEGKGERQRNEHDIDGKEESLLERIGCILP